MTNEELDRIAVDAERAANTGNARKIEALQVRATIEIAKALTPDPMPEPTRIPVDRPSAA